MALSSFWEKAFDDEYWMAASAAYYLLFGDKKISSDALNTIAHECLFKSNGGALEVIKITRHFMESGNISDEELYASREYLSTLSMVFKRFGRNKFSQLDFITWALSKRSLQIPFEMLYYMAREVAHDKDTIEVISNSTAYNREELIEIFRDMHYNPTEFMEEIKKLTEHPTENDENSRNVPDIKEPDTRRKHSYIMIIKSLCDIAGIDYSQRGAASRIKCNLEKSGFEISDDTIRSILREIQQVVDLKGK